MTNWTELLEKSRNQPGNGPAGESELKPKTEGAELQERLHAYFDATRAMEGTQVNSPEVVQRSKKIVEHFLIENNIVPADFVNFAYKAGCRKGEELGNLLMEFYNLKADSVIGIIHAAAGQYDLKIED